MALQKKDGGIRPILCGEIWRRRFASLAVNTTPVRNEAAKLLTPTYDNFIQTAGIRDGASHCAKIISSSGFARPLDSSILTLIFYSVFVAFCSNSMLIAKLLMRS
jgi:hypothetical protein